ncbi:MAG: YceH family protein [Rubricoccaceae bacterium]
MRSSLILPPRQLVAMTLPTLDATERRVVGALAEKALATPDHYPLSLNALRAACNQKSARDPVMDLSEREVTDAILRLQRRGLVGTTSGSGHRVSKFRHNLDRGLDLSRRELAILTVLLLRGAQTSGELRQRTARLADFASTEGVEEALWMLSDRDEPIVRTLPRGPGQSTDRYTHQLGGTDGHDDSASSTDATATASEDAMPSPTVSRVDRPAPRQREREAGGELVNRVEALEQEVASLREALEAFRAQFE